MMVSQWNATKDIFQKKLSTTSPETLLEVTTNANTSGNGNKVSASKSFKNQDRLHKKHAVDEAIESNTGRSIGNNVAAVAPWHLLIEYDDRNMPLANANTCGNRNKLFAAEAYKNDNHLHTKQPTDEAIQSMTGLPLGSNTGRTTTNNNALANVKDYGKIINSLSRGTYTNKGQPHKHESVNEPVGTNSGLRTRNNKSEVALSTDMDIIDPYNLKTCDILEVINDNNCQQQQQPSKNINDSYYGNSHVLQQPNYARKHRQPFRRPEAKSHNVQHNHLQHQPRIKCRNRRSYKSHAGPIDTEYLAQESVSKLNSCFHIIHLANMVQQMLLWRAYHFTASSRIPQYVKELYGNAHFMDNIRAYNQMFSMTSVRANVDKSINKGKGPYVYRISGQIYHWIRSMCPDEGQPPRFLQLYIYDTTNEVKNRLSHFGNEHEPELKEEIVEGLTQLLDNHNALVQLFRTARNKYMDADIPEFKVRLYSVIGTRRYELPTSEIVGAIVFADSSAAENDFDLIIEEHSRFPQRGNKLHPSYIPRYMYAHYPDALAIFRVHGSPSFFITFTCNAKWPEIEEYIKPFLLLTTADRADIIDRIFERKVRDYINFVRNFNTFGDVTGVLYTIEFQKCGLPHCHSLLWINVASRVQQGVNVDEYVCAEFPNPISDVNTYAVISELMIHGPCGYANPSAACMKDDGRCNHIQKINNKIYPTNKAACQALGLLGGDEEWVTTIQEASLFATSSKLRNLFVYILIFCNVSDPMKLWEKLWKDLCDDIPWKLSKSLRIPQIQTNEKNLKATTLFDIERKTFIWKAVTTALRLEEKIVLTVAASEIKETERIHIQNFSTWLLHIGDGTICDPDETDDEDTFTVQMPTELCIPDSDTTLATLISFIYDQKTLQTPTLTDLQKKAIVCPKNENADMINAQVLSLVNSQQHVYLSLDEAMPHGNDGGETELLYPLEYLNSLNFANFPPHRLELKVGAPIILLRNLNISCGLCNGTRLIVRQLLSKVIEARIITGTRISEKVFLPRIPLINPDLTLPFIFKRKQFPIKLCYTMTINKSQCQSLERIGIFLPEHVFAHGQL
nr:ATP-dependent DNA helicase PIF1-like [Tanacetum cinerariifolium]